MSVGISFTLCSFFFIVLLAIVYFSKNRLKTEENKIYSLLVITSLLGTVIGVPCYYFIKNYQLYPFANFFFARMYLVYLITWLLLFSIYTLIITFPKFNYSKEKKKLGAFYIILIIFSLALPLYYNTEIVYSYGPAVNFVYAVSSVFIVIVLFCLFKNIKIIMQKRYFPLIFFILFGTIVMIIQKLNPGLLLLTFCEAFITFLMYFTIENPDVKMIEELNKNRLLVNKTMEDKSNFIFLASSKIKGPINDMGKLIGESKNLNDLELVKEKLNKLDNLYHLLSFQVENIMNISNLTYKNIKIVNTKYNPLNLLQKIRLVKEKEFKNGVEFRVNITETLPKYLYGDSKLLEQVITSILDNAIKYTSTGFIELNVNTIVKYDMCRIMITIEDSGKGISIDKVNDLLIVDEPLNKEDFERLETNNIDINTIKKIVTKMGGYFTLKSEEGVGTEVKIVVDQMIELESEKEINNSLNKENILIASSDQEFLASITKLMTKKGYQIESSIYANDVLDKIRVQEKFSCILLDDMLDIRAYEVLQELKKNSKFKIPVIIMLDKDQEFIKEHFIKDGFSDYLLKDNLGNEIKRLFK